MKQIEFTYWNRPYLSIKGFLYLRDSFNIWDWTRHSSEIIQQVYAQQEVIE